MSIEEQQLNWSNKIDDELNDVNLRTERLCTDISLFGMSLLGQCQNENVTPLKVTSFKPIQLFCDIRHDVTTVFVTFKIENDGFVTLIPITKRTYYRHKK